MRKLMNIYLKIMLNKYKNISRLCKTYTVRNVRLK